MSTTTNAVTADQLLQMGADSHLELIKGELRPLSPGGFGHGVIGMRLGAHLLLFVEEKRLGMVCGAETGFRLARDPDTVLAPDVAFVRRGRIPDGPPSPFFWEGAPDLAVEVLSPSDSAYEMAKKAGDWLSFGTQIVWVVDPKKETLTIYRNGFDTRVLMGEEILDGGDLLPGFQLRVAEIFQS